MELLKRVKQSQWYGVSLLLIVTALCWILFKIMCPDTFGAPDQMLTYLQTGLIYAVGGCGLYFIVVMGLWDFSIGSVLVLSCLLSIGFSQMFGVAGLVIAPIFCGVLLGAANGLAYIALRIPSLIVTVVFLLSMRVYRFLLQTGLEQGCQLSINYLVPTHGTLFLQ